jgi:hypothetical protein
VAAGGGNILSHNGGAIVAAGGGNVVVNNGGNIVAAGRGNIVAAGGGNIVAAGGGNIVAAGGGNIANGPTRNSAEATSYSGGTLGGAGTFQGPGVIQSGGALQPGSNIGTLTWNGPLAVENGGVIEIEIGGTASGQYDAVNVSGAVTMNGALNLQFVNGFGSNVQPGHVFDVITAGSPIVTGLNGSRVSVAGSYGTFEVQLVNGGKTLRLANYQAGAVTFNAWANRYNLSGANAAWNADPNNNGILNLLEYALGLDPTAVGGSRGTNVGTVTDGTSKYLSLSYTKPTGADAPTDIAYVPELATSLTAPNWSSSSVDIVTHSITPGPGNLETVTIRSAHPISAGGKQFLHLKVTQISQ